MYRIGVDIGGTFTDFAMYDARAGRMGVHKQLTTPKDPSAAVIAGVQVLIDRHKITLTDVTDIVHGTTLVTNAVIERRGALTDTWMPVTGVPPKSIGMRSGWRCARAVRTRSRDVIVVAVMEPPSAGFPERTQAH